MPRRKKPANPDRQEFHDTIAHWLMGKAKPASTLSLLEMDDMVSIAAGYMKVHDDDLIRKFPEWEYFKDDTKANMAHRVAGAWHRAKRKNAAKSGVYKSTSSERVDSHFSSFHTPTKIRLHETFVTDTLVDHPSSSTHLPRSVSTSLPLQSASIDLLLILGHLPSRPHTQKPPRHYAPKPLMEQRPKKRLSVQAHLPEGGSLSSVEPHILSQLPLAEGFEMDNTETTTGNAEEEALPYRSSYQPFDDDELNEYLDPSMLYRRD